MVGREDAEHGVGIAMAGVQRGQAERGGGRTTDRLDQGVTRLSDLQARLAAQETYGVLVVLQALDAANKPSCSPPVPSC